MHTEGKKYYVLSDNIGTLIFPLIVIICILAAIAIPNYMQIRDKKKFSDCKNAVSQLYNKIKSKDVDKININTDFISQSCYGYNKTEWESKSMIDFTNKNGVIIKAYSKDRNNCLLIAAKGSVIPEKLQECENRR